MRKLSLFSGVLTAISLSFAAEAIAQTPECGPFQVYLGNGNLEIVDLGGTGLTIGDRRVGSLELLDSDGTVIGYNLFDTTVVGNNEGRYQLIGDSVHVYDNGTVHYRLVYELPDPGQPEPQINVPSFEYPVTGGTNLFTGAHGIVRTSRGDDGRRVIALDISCDD